MATRVLRNVDISKVVALQLPRQIAEVHRQTAIDVAAARGFRDNYSVFAFRKYQKPRKFTSIQSIPDSVLVMPASIGITTQAGRNLAAFVAREFVRNFLRLAPVRTQNYRSSLRLTLNGRMRALSTILKIQEVNPLKQGEIIEIWSAVEYASTLEAPNYNIDGIFLKITKLLLSRYGGTCAIRFTYRSGQKLGLGFKYMTPVVMIGARGEFASSITTRRGYQMRRRKRELGKINKARKKAGKRPLKARKRRK